MAQVLFESEAFQKSIIDGLNTAMLRAVEPLVKRALQDIEETMRGELAARLISTIQRDFVMSFHGQEMRIVLNQTKREA